MKNTKEEQVTLKTNNEILQDAIDTGLLDRCIECQFSKLEDRQFEQDFYQDLCLIILEYDNEKLNNAYRKHFNAFLTRIIQNNIFSVNSHYYKDYIKYQNHKVDFELPEDTNDEDTDYE